MTRMYCAIDADNNFRKAQQIKSKYNRKLEKLQIKSRHGDKQAAVLIIQTMARQNEKLRDVGYRLTGEGRLTPITEEWRQQQLAQESAVDRMSRLVRNGEACVGDLIRLMAREED